jgi:DNA mismatch endonuclease (patch repair protein)
MAQIKSKDTKPEALVRKRLFSMGLRYRKNDKRYPGRPDIVLPKHKAIVFVNGCFWHAHESCPHFRMPKSRPEYWEPKLAKNKARDIASASALREDGWKVIYVWECELAPDKVEERLQRLYEEITGASLESAGTKAEESEEAASFAEDGRLNRFAGEKEIGKDEGLTGENEPGEGKKLPEEKQVDDYVELSGEKRFTE